MRSEGNALGLPRGRDILGIASAIRPNLHRYVGTALASECQSNCDAICAWCERPATAVIPATEESVCNEYATELCQPLLRFAITRRRRCISRERPDAAVFHETAREWSAGSLASQGQEAVGQRARRVVVP